MPTDLTELYTIRHVQPGDPVSAPVSSQPTKAIELRLRALENAIYSSQLNNSQSRLVIPDVAINNTVGQAVTVNSVVYYNNATGLYEKAVAGATFSQDQFLANASALALGVCIAVRGNKGDIMVSGYSAWTSEIRSAMLVQGEVFRAGVPYYLSEDALQAGRVTQYAPSLRVQVLSATQEHYILQPEYGVPEVLETVSRVSLGARPVGGMRVDEVSGQLCRIVGFDALEEIQPSVWISTKDSSIYDLKQFGWLAADISLEQIPSQPVWIRVNLIAGVVTVYTANSLEKLTSVSGGAVFNSQNYGNLDSINYSSVREYRVKESSTASFDLGTFSFSFISPDVSLNRMCIFQFPASFQGWKMVNPPVTPQGIAVVSNSHVAGVTLIDGGTGFLTAPRVTFSLPPSGSEVARAKGTAQVNTAGSVQSVQIDDGGIGYFDVVTEQAIIPTVTFDSAVRDVSVTNAGSGAVILASVGTGSEAGRIVSITVTSGGSGYLSTPSILLVDNLGVGYGATALPTVVDGVITSAVVTNGGSGYTANQVRAEVILTSNFGYAVSAQPDVTVNMGADNVLSVTVLANAGWRIINGGKVRFVMPEGSLPTIEAQGYAVANPLTGKLESVIVTNQGEGYAGVPTVEFPIYQPRLKTEGGTPVALAKGTLVMSPATVSQVTIQAPGIRYTGVPGGPGGLNWVPLLFELAACPGGDYAVGKAVLDTAGSVVDIVLQHGGSGYLYPPYVILNDGGGSLGYGFVGRVELNSSVLDATVTDSGKQYKAPTESAAACPVKSVITQNRGSGYEIGTVLLAEGGNPILPAILEPIFDGAGGLAGASVIYPGKGYTTVPTIVRRGPGINATWPTLTIPGGQLAGTNSIVGPVISTSLHGTDYLAGPTCSVSPPDLSSANGETAVIKPRVGGTLSHVKIVNSGTGQTRTAGVEPEIVLSTTQYGWGVKLRPRFNVTGQLIAVDILNPGTGYAQGDTVNWSYTGVTGGTLATLEFTFEGYDAITRVDVVQPGWGYVFPPTLSVSAPLTSQHTRAILEASLLGVGAKLKTDMWGLGPPLLNNPLTGRNMFQIRSWYDDLGYQLGRIKPEVAFYYNLWADLSLRQRYPPVPLDRASFVLNGTELSVTTLSEDFKPTVISADVWLAMDAIYWPTADSLGAPWDSSFALKINAPGMTGVDCIIPDSAALPENRWRWRSHVYNFQPQLNVTWMHLGRASQFYTAGRVSGLAVVPPLQLVNLLTGEILSDTGRPATGILGLQMANSGSIFNSDATVDLAQPNVLLVIYQNNQRQPVYLSSFLLRVMFQSVSTGEVATVNASARITIGTQQGNYQNMVGNYNPATPNNSSVATTLYGMGQVKELLPDQTFPSVLVYPGESVYLRVAVPAGNPIRQQTVNISVRGYVL